MTITLTALSALAAALIEAESACAAAEEALAAAKEKARFLREESLPSALQELGVEAITLDSGMKLAVKQEVYASIPAENKPGAFAWLNEHGYGGLIKLAVECEFGKGEQERAAALAESMREQGLSARVDESVHPQTLKAFLREQISKGAPVPLELFGARPVWTTKITTK